LADISSCVNCRQRGFHFFVRLDKTAISAVYFLIFEKIGVWFTAGVDKDTIYIKFAFFAILVDQQTVNLFVALDFTNRCIP